MNKIAHISERPLYTLVLLSCFWNIVLMWKSCWHSRICVVVNGEWHWTPELYSVSSCAWVNQAILWQMEKIGGVQQKLLKEKIGFFSVMECISFSGSKSRREKPLQSVLTGRRSTLNRATAMVLLRQFSILGLRFLLKGTSNRKQEQESKDVTCCSSVVPNQKHIVVALGLQPASPWFIMWSPYPPCFSAPER